MPVLPFLVVCDLRFDAVFYDKSGKTALKFNFFLKSY